ncbi:hypothetical protein [Streptomyces candidus]|uniref:Uncharacterized protein n=1 Tax=Streptomyces candidus TaxID=67283 RepID=A0A7X0HCJ0_9ACTN|nr:hypothetical protein [Streptomyces candidus]MBB6434044.1 hypothetical protein [Streptomyces candidus]GHH33550.1 hypothetical protein GCM10018773_04270 [Streptomyces candidus]
MARHRRPVPVRPAAVAERARRHVAGGLLGASALAAACLVVLVEPAAPPAPDRMPDRPAAGSSDFAQDSSE